MARNYLGMLLCEEERFGEAEAQFAAAVRENPECMEAQFNLVDLLQRRGALDEAEARLPWIEDHWPNRWETHELLGKIAQKRGDHEASARHLRIVQQLKGDVQSLGLAERINFRLNRKGAAGHRASP
jgi:Tfp pilus assembly protein PilF